MSPAEWWQQQPPSVPEPSLSAGPPSPLHSKQRRPPSPVRVRSSAGCNLQHPASKYQVLQETSGTSEVEQHIAVLTFPCMGLQDPSRPRLAPSPSKTWGRGQWYRLSGWRVPRESTVMLQSLLERRACVRVCARGNQLEWRDAAPLALHSQGAAGPGGEPSRGGILATNSWLGLGLGRGNCGMSFLRLVPFLCFIHIPAPLCGKRDRSEHRLLMGGSHPRCELHWLRGWFQDSSGLNGPTHIPAGRLVTLPSRAGDRYLAGVAFFTDTVAAGRTACGKDKWGWCP